MATRTEGIRWLASQGVQPEAYDILRTTNLTVGEIEQVFDFDRAIAGAYTEQEFDFVLRKSWRDYSKGVPKSELNHLGPPFYKRDAASLGPITKNGSPNGVHKQVVSGCVSAAGARLNGWSSDFTNLVGSVNFYMDSARDGLKFGSKAALKPVGGRKSVDAVKGLVSGVADQRKQISAAMGASDLAVDAVKGYESFARNFVRLVEVEDVRIRHKRGDVEQLMEIMSELNAVEKKNRSFRTWMNGTGRNRDVFDIMAGLVSDEPRYMEDLVLEVDAAVRRAKAVVQDELLDLVGRPVTADLFGGAPDDIWLLPRALEDRRRALEDVREVFSEAGIQPAAGLRTFEIPEVLDEQLLAMDSFLERFGQGASAWDEHLETLGSRASTESLETLRGELSSALGSAWTASRQQAFDRFVESAQDAVWGAMARSLPADSVSEATALASVLSKQNIQANRVEFNRLFKGDELVVKKIVREELKRIGEDPDLVEFLAPSQRKDMLMLSDAEFAAKRYRVGPTPTSAPTEGTALELAKSKSNRIVVPTGRNVVPAQPNIVEGVPVWDVDVQRMTVREPKKVVGKSKEFRGLADKVFFEDPSGNVWMLKGDVATVADSPALAEQAAHQISAIAGLPTPPGRAINLVDEGFEELFPGSVENGFIQRFWPASQVDHTDTWGSVFGSPINLFTGRVGYKKKDLRILDDIKEQVAENMVLDWLVMNYDTHPGNFLISKDRKTLLGIDKGLAFRVESPTATIHSFNIANSDPYFNFEYHYFSGDIGKIDWDEVARSVDRIHHIDDDTYESMIRPFLETVEGEYFDAEKAVQFYVNQKKRVREQFEDFVEYMEKTRADRLEIDYEPWVPIWKPERAGFQALISDDLTPEQVAEFVRRAEQTAPASAVDESVIEVLDEVGDFTADEIDIIVYHLKEEGFVDEVGGVLNSPTVEVVERIADETLPKPFIPPLGYVESRMDIRALSEVPQGPAAEMLFDRTRKTVTPEEVRELFKVPNAQIIPEDYDEAGLEAINDVFRYLLDRFPEEVATLDTVIAGDVDWAVAAVLDPRLLPDGNLIGTTLLINPNKFTKDIIKRFEDLESYVDKYGADKFWVVPDSFDHSGFRFVPRHADQPRPENAWSMAEFDQLRFYKALGVGENPVYGPVVSGATQNARKVVLHEFGHIWHNAHGVHTEDIDSFYDVFMHKTGAGWWEDWAVSVSDDPRAVIGYGSNELNEATAEAFVLREVYGSDFLPDDARKWLEFIESLPVVANSEEGIGPYQLLLEDVPK